jgi:tetratricopeptide (TPR) repeat protein
MINYPSQFQAFVQQLENKSSAIVESAPYLVETSTQKEVSSPSLNVQNQAIINQDQDSEGGHMDKQRREVLQQGIGFVGASTLIPAIGHQDLIANVQRVLHQPSSGLGDKELTYLEQKITLYWQARHNMTIAPADLIAHVTAYVQEVMTLLDRSLLPSIRMRLCVCLSQGMLLIGACLYGQGQFQTAREYFQMAVQAAHEAEHNILQALAWGYHSFSWFYSSEIDRYKHAKDSRLKACHFASLESDLAVECWTQAGLAQVYARLKDRTACLEALKQASKLNEHVLGDWYFIHQFGLSKLNGDRGLCLQQFYQSGVPDTYPLLEESEQVLQEALSQPNVSVLRRTFYVVDMAHVHARRGNVEAACDYAMQIIGMAGNDNPLKQRLLEVCTHLEPYSDVQVVKGLESEIKALVLAE